MRMIERVQVYGQRCSGTNALIRSIDANFPELRFTEEFGFKHWLVPGTRDFPEDVMVVVIAREVGEWLRSLHRNPWHAKPDMKRLSFSDFIRAPWESVWDEDFWGVTPSSPQYGTPIREERCPVTGAAFENAAAMRTAKLSNWVQAGHRAGAKAFVPHGDLVVDPGRVLDAIAAAAGLPTSREWKMLHTYKGEGQKAFVPKAYEPLSRADRQFVDEHLDPDLERLFFGDCAKTAILAHANSEVGVGT